MMSIARGPATRVMISPLRSASAETVVIEKNVEAPVSAPSGETRPKRAVLPHARLSNASHQHLPQGQTHGRMKSGRNSSGLCTAGLPMI